MVVAGLATTPGGNLLGPIMAFAGLLLAMAGASGEAKPDAGTVGWTLAHAGVLAAAMWGALGTMVLLGIPSLLLAVVVAGSTRWRNPSLKSRSPEPKPHRSS
jgi:hypothetical protein